MPFLDEQEWQQIEPLLPLAKQELIDYRIAHNCDLTTAKRNCYSQATQIFELMTGLPGFHFDVIYHHRLCDWGKNVPVVVTYCAHQKPHSVLIVVGVQKASHNFRMHQAN